MRAGAAVDSYCGGAGTCGKCRVRVLNTSQVPTPGEAAHLTPEELAGSIRLACYLEVEDGMVVETLGGDAPALLTGGLEKEVAVNPLVQQVEITAPQGSILTSGTSLLRSWNRQGAEQ